MPMCIHEDGFAYLHHLGSSQFQEHLQGNLILQSMRLLVEECSLAALDSLQEFYEGQVLGMRKAVNSPLDPSPER